MAQKLNLLVLQFIKFGIVGVLNVVVNLIIYYVLLACGLHYIWANTVGYIAGIINSYFWNNRFVFHMKDEGKLLQKFGKVCICYGLTYIINTGLLYILVDKIKFAQSLSPILVLFVTVPINFVLNRFWAFRKEDK